MKLPTDFDELEALYNTIDPELPFEALSAYQLAIMEAFDWAVAQAEIAAEKEALEDAIPTDLSELAKLVEAIDSAKPEGSRSEREQAVTKAYRHTQKAYEAETALATAREEAAIKRWIRDCKRAGESLSTTKHQ